MPPCYEVMDLIYYFLRNKYCTCGEDIFDSQSFCVGYKSNLNHEGHEDHEVDVNRK